MKKYVIKNILKDTMKRITFKRPFANHTDFEYKSGKP